MKKLVFFVVVSLLSAASFSQELSLSFKETTHDFGTVSENTGKISYDFEFTNIGSTPVALTNVRASCGCTTPNWTKEPVAPGKKGIIKVTYSTTGRPGKFNKSITVTSTADGTTGTTTLYIKGDVTPKSPTSNFQVAPTTSFDGISLSREQISFSLTPNGSKTEFIQLENKGNVSVKIELGTLPDYMNIKSNIRELKPGEKGTIAIGCNASKIKKAGTYENSLSIQVSNASGKKYDQKVLIQTIVKN